MDVLEIKGIQYLIVMGYLGLLTVFYWWLARTTQTQPLAPTAAATPFRQPVGAGWFEVPSGFHFHRGHTWARRESDDVFRVGMADFAQKLLGRADELLLPKPGDSLEQGRPGWRFALRGESLDLLSPLSGTVVEANPEAAANPGAVCEDPYGRGWLLKVRAPQPDVALNNLLPSELAEVWTARSAAQLNWLMGADAGVVLQDGGVPVSGFARELAGDRWREMAARLLLTS